ncbi:MAG: hypothetical protein K1X53_13425 [Candidatus Sumerlaeaceae bacterium]|nr:hypothetical protein [Candidatus Sumerlaeaceae bacterium]
MRRTTVLLAACAMMGISLGAKAATPSSGFENSVPADTKRITIKLYASADPNVQGTTNNQLNAETLPENQREIAGFGKYVSAMDLGTFAGTRFRAYLRPNAQVNYLSRNSGELLDMLVTAETSDGRKRPEKIAEGSVAFGNQAEIKFPRKTDPIGANGLTESSTLITLSVNGRNGSNYNGYGSVKSNLSLAGTTLLSNAKVTVSLPGIFDRTVSPDNQITITATPLEGNFTALTGTGKIGEPVAVGKAQVVVASLTPDLSSVDLAVLSGDLTTFDVKKPRSFENIPDFERVDLFARRIVGRDEILSATKAAGPAVFIFGEPKLAEGPYYGGPVGSNFNMTEQQIVESLQKDNPKPPTVVFVSRAINMKSLYDEYLGRKPDYFFLSDFDNPLNTQFRSNPNYGGPTYYSGPGAPQTIVSLRDQIGLPQNNVGILVSDSAGKVIISKPEVGPDLRGALLEINKALRDAK